MWCPEPDSNRHRPFGPRDFKSASPLARQYHVEGNEANSEGFYGWRVRFGASGFRRFGHSNGHSLGTHRPGTWHARPGVFGLRGGSQTRRKNKKRLMANRTDTKIAVLIQEMVELGFDRETIAKISNVPQRTVSDIVNWRGCWASTGEFNEVRERRTGST
jgi:hypothetical protein